MAPTLSPQAKRIVGLALTVTLIGSVVLGGAALAVSNTAAQEEQGDATVRIVHASPDAPAVDVYVDDEQIASGVEFGTVTDYMSVSQGMHNVTVTAAGDSEDVLFESQVDVDASGTYTVAASGEVSEDAETSFEPVVFTDDASQPADDEAAVRLAHLSPDAPAVDVTVEETGDVLFDNVTFRNATEYQTVPAGDYTLEVRAATESNDGDVVATFDVSPEGGTAYTAFAVGYLDAEDDEEGFDLVVAEDQVSEEETATGTELPTEMGTETEMGTVTETEEETETETETETPAE
ncbi:DUF4397 domain-containing protein [Halorarum halophilum]|uniref:DUF4397 domain-containing protein n=1 Tax=Halorarum halophilum TaxID=2743090 RepID=A0A7D5GC58_9EURY|nr:DUF4397 domain-containing protein [Halobaculum halophilum]QLG28012.1 DUF4397 domain-containing protein [Halobaculum halophilum]